MYIDPKLANVVLSVYGVLVEECANKIISDRKS